MSYDALFSTIKIRGLELKNRVLLPGMNTKMVRNKHDVGDDLAAYHAARAAGGCALNILEVAAICPQTHAYFYYGLYTDEDVESFRKVTEAIHDAGGKAGIQLWHGGFVPEQFFDESNRLETPDTLSVEDIHRVIADYGAAAARAVAAGFDMVEYHAAHTYLPHEFLNPYMNTRTDEYGGSFENRCRFLLECIRAIRDNIPEEMPLFMRLDAIDEMMPKNIPEEEIVAFINLAADAGVDLVDLSRGNARSNATVYEVPPFNLPCGFNAEIVANIKRQVKIPVAVVGRINTPALADALIAEGKADMVAVGRAQLADPEWCLKAQTGREDEIRMCIACTQGCYESVIDPNAPHITCTHNPALCLEYQKIPPAQTPKKVMVIGGGMGGMIAAEQLQHRGHKPEIYEASDRLGGRFLLAGVAPKKEEFTRAALWEGETVKRLGIPVHLGCTVTPELIAEEKPDHVIIAIGSQLALPEIPGIDGKNVWTQDQVLKGEVTPTGNVVILGGGGVGTEIATLLAEKGASVTIIDPKRVGSSMGMLRKMFMELEFPGYGIKRSSFSKVYEIGENVVRYKQTDRKTKKVSDREKAFDALVIACGEKSADSSALQEACTALGIPFDVIGDAARPADALAATKAAWAAANAVV